MYGHSIPNKLSYIPATPPFILYHGTIKTISKTILNEGLKPMSRQYVHLSTNVDIAKEVAKRKGKDIVILEIDSSKAFNEGVKFFMGNEYVWLCSELPYQYIQLKTR